MIYSEVGSIDVLRKVRCNLNKILDGFQRIILEETLTPIVIGTIIYTLREACARKGQDRTGQ